MEANVRKYNTKSTYADTTIIIMGWEESGERPLIVSALGLGGDV